MAKDTFMAGQSSDLISLIHEQCGEEVLMRSVFRKEFLPKGMRYSSAQVVQGVAQMPLKQGVVCPENMQVALKKVVADAAEKSVQIGREALESDAVRRSMRCECYLKGAPSICYIPVSGHEMDVTVVYTVHWYICY